MKRYPELASLYHLVKEFNRIVFSKKPEELNTWIIDAESIDNIAELKSYIEGLKRDYEAVADSRKYYSDVTYGDQIKAMALYSEGVMSISRIAVFLNAIMNGDLGLSEGSIYGFCKKFVKRVEAEIARLEAGLLN